jgi:RES domain
MSMPHEPRGPDHIKVTWSKAWRIIASRFPPIDLFERISSNPAMWETLAELEQATNPRVRDEIGEIALVPPNRRVAGAGASWIMAPFTHVNPRGSRFSNGSYGVYYAAHDLETALRETIYHFEKFASDARDPPRREDMRVLVGKISNTFDDVESLSIQECTAVLDANSYAASQPFGQKRREAGSHGIVYPSVRHPGGRCLGAFWPDVVDIPLQERHLQFEWDGKRVRRYFDFSSETWSEV